ncbi:FAD/NAD-binding domain-containing protein [Lentinula edodes]|nr:FAD/NAD-binding domain-containing protein [Lentinula edodes]
MTIYEMKTVVVLGGAYAGARTVQVLSKGLPEGWRIVLVDRNTHINHVYVFPRLAILPGHEHKGFIPFSRLLDPTRHQDLCLHASVRSVHSSYVVLDRSFPERGVPTPELRFDYLVYALGSRLPAPLDLWGSSPESGRASHKDAVVFKPYAGTKQEGISWLKTHQEVIKSSDSILVVGGGALGIQFATDISAIYPNKTITLLHSRHRLLPRFDEKMHTEIMDALLASNIQVILGERLDMQSILFDNAIKLNKLGQRVARTLQGREVAADLILLCTGQKPNTHLLSAMDPRCVNPHDGLAHVIRTMQLGVVLSTSPPTFSNFTSESSTPSPSWSASTSTSSTSSLLSPEQELEDALAQVALVEKNVGIEEPLSGLSISEEDDDVLDSNLDGEDGAELSTPYPNIFVAGDAADAFGAIPAGHTAYYQGEVAARNILRLIQRSECPLKIPQDEGVLVMEEEEERLEHYAPGLPAIKISLGLTKSAYQANGVVRTADDGVPDLNAAAIWGYFGYEVEKEEDMYA